MWVDLVGEQQLLGPHDFAQTLRALRDRGKENCGHECAWNVGVRHLEGSSWTPRHNAWTSILAPTLPGQPAPTSHRSDPWGRGCGFTAHQLNALGLVPGSSELELPPSVTPGLYSSPHWVGVSSFKDRVHAKYPTPVLAHSGTQGIFVIPSQHVSLPYILLKNQLLGKDVPREAVSSPLLEITPPKSQRTNRVVLEDVKITLVSCTEWVLCTRLWTK